jgi:hypothetical protein
MIKSIKDVMAKSAWELAQKLGIQYVGDSSPFDHGGTFYETNNWGNYGYARCVSFQSIEGRTLVESGIINCPSKVEEVHKAHDCCDCPVESRDTATGQIESCLGYFGFERDYSDYAEWFKQDQEYKCWKKCLPWILSLRDDVEVD